MAKYESDETNRTAQGFQTRKLVVKTELVPYSNRILSVLSSHESGSNVNRDQSLDHGASLTVFSVEKEKDYCDMGIDLKPLSVSKGRNLRRYKLQHFRKAMEIKIGADKLQILTVARDEQHIDGKPLSNLVELIGEISIHEEL